MVLDTNLPLWLRRSLRGFGTLKKRNQKYVQRHLEPDAPILKARSLFWACFVKNIVFAATMCHYVYHYYTTLSKLHPSILPLSATILPLSATICHCLYIIPLLPLCSDFAKKLFKKNTDSEMKHAENNSPVEVT